MLLTPHVIVGIATAMSVENPFIAVPFSFVMHFVGDMVPHWDFYTGTTREERFKGWRPLGVMADLALGVAVGVTATLYALWVLKNPMLATSVFLCGVASVLPDALTGPSLYVGKQANGVFKKVHEIQSKMQFPAGLPWGLVTQFIIVAVCSLVILNSVSL